MHAVNNTASHITYIKRAEALNNLYDNNTYINHLQQLKGK